MHIFTDWACVEKNTTYYQQKFADSKDEYKN